MTTQRTPEFIRLNGNAIRVTSWTPLEEPGTFRLITIVRGTADASRLVDLLSQQPLELEIPGEPVRPVYPDRLERHDTGEPPATISRISIDLSSNPAGPQSAATKRRSLDDRVTALEQDVSQLKALIESLVNKSG